MFWPISKPFPSGGFVEELGELHKLRIAIQMDKDAGLLNLHSLFWIYLRMLRVMLRFVFFSCKFSYPGSVSVG